MSARPRFAGDGRLRLPEERTCAVSPMGQRGHVVNAYLGPDTYDPFERVAGDILLAEAFARLELEPSDALVAWFEHHGLVALALSLPSETSVHGLAFLAQVADAVTDIAAQQRNVAWHLESIAHLSDHLVAQPGTSATIPWEPRWVQPVLEVGGGHCWLGAEDWRERNLLPGMERSARAPRRRHPLLSEEEWRDWWRRGHASWERIRAEAVPIVRVVTDVGRIDTMRGELLEMVAGDLTKGIGTRPWDLVKLQRRLMAPYIAVAGEHRVEVGWPDDDAHDGSASEDLPLVVHERRTWDSLLAPVYVQLLEGLRRVTEGQRGAAFCKECGQPFLTLDARRSAFCNDRERYRYGQRQHRRRASGATSDEP